MMGQPHMNNLACNYRMLLARLAAKLIWRRGSASTLATNLLKNIVYNVTETHD